MHDHLVRAPTPPAASSSAACVLQAACGWAIDPLHDHLVRVPTPPAAHSSAACALQAVCGWAIDPLHVCCRQFVAGPLTHCMLGFEVQGGWRDVKTSVVMTALQYLMGGGGSFSAGGPGIAVLTLPLVQIYHCL